MRWVMLGRLFYEQGWRGEVDVEAALDSLNSKPDEQN
jgi:ribosomal 30S subunit maturation factor RimM